jgi:hypothetical protein
VSKRTHPDAVAHSATHLKVLHSLISVRLPHSLPPCSAAAVTTRTRCWWPAHAHARTHDLVTTRAQPHARQAVHTAAAALGALAPLAPGRGLAVLGGARLRVALLHLRQRRAGLAAVGRLGHDGADALLRAPTHSESPGQCHPFWCVRCVFGSHLVAAAARLGAIGPLGEGRELALRGAHASEAGLELGGGAARLGQQRSARSARRRWGGPLRGAHRAAECARDGGLPRPRARAVATGHRASGPSAPLVLLRAVEALLRHCRTAVREAGPPCSPAGTAGRCRPAAGQDRRTACARGQ